MNTRKLCLFSLLLLVLPALGQAQDDSDSSADAAQLGVVHGFVPATWNASMISIADLQTQEGQDWFNGLQAAASLQGQTQYVCSNPTQLVTSTNTGDFFFNDLPAGSYAIAACMQTPEGHWRSGTSVISLEPGETSNVALGVTHGYPVYFNGAPVVVSYYVGFGDPFWFGPTWGWRWHAGMWGARFTYVVPARRAAPIWIRPGVVVVGARIAVPPYREVYAGHASYMAWRNGAYVRAVAHSGAFVPPVGVHAVVRPAIPDRIVNNNVTVVRTAIVNKTTINNVTVNNSNVNRTTVINNNGRTNLGATTSANNSVRTTAAVPHTGVQTNVPRQSIAGTITANNNRAAGTTAAPAARTPAPAVAERASAPPVRETQTRERPEPAQHQSAPPVEHASSASSSSATSTKKKP